jgi:nitrogen fixation protein
VLELSDYIYMEELENTVIAVNQKDKAQWLGETKLTNNVQAQVGLSIFLPFTWEYRLPK